MVKKLTPAEYRKKWGLPDWHDATSYPQKLPDIAWRWEFLRRRADYRQDWEGLKAKTFYGGLYPKKVCDHWIEKYGIQILADPSSKGVFGFTGAAGFYKSGTFYGPAVSRTPLMVPKGHVAMVFNLHLPIPPQIEDAKNQLTLIQEELKKGAQAFSIPETRLHWKKLSWYLRALDAEGEHATDEDIYAVLRGRKSSSARKRVAEILNSAHQAQDLLTDPTRTCVFVRPK